MFEGIKMFPLNQTLYVCLYLNVTQHPTDKYNPFCDVSAKHFLVVLGTEPMALHMKT